MQNYANTTLLRALMALLPVCALLAGSVVFFVKRKAAASWLQVLGAGCLLIVVLSHLCEALHLLQGMRWGLQQSVGHYLDLSSAILGLTLFPVGYLISALTPRQA